MRTFLMACLLVCAALPAAADSTDAAFERTYAQARANEYSGDGYDARLAQYLDRNDEVRTRWTDCVKNHADKPDLRGWFEFGAAGGYRVVLRPDTPFSRCIAAALEGQAVPEPPRRPYVHGLSFTMAPTAAP